MTDVKCKTATEGQMTTRRMEASGHNNIANTHISQDLPKLGVKMRGKGSLVSDSSLSKAQNMLDKDCVGAGIDEENSEESKFPREGLCETCACKDIGCGIYDETSLDSSSADSQSVLADSDIDHLFEEIFTGSSLSRSLSSSSSSEEDFDESDGLNDSSFLNDDNDWDSFTLIGNPEDEWSIAMSILGNLPHIDSVRTLRRRGETEETPPLYPHRALMYHECQVCLSRVLLRRRVCCDFHICTECMSAYVSVKVNEAKVQIECPNDRCSVLIHRDEVKERLPIDMKDKFAKFLVNANADPLKKTCPACSEVYTIEQKVLSSNKKKLKYGVKVKCPQCNLLWCFQCQAPFHTEITCKQYQKGDKMVKKWAKELSAGQSNAQKCPKCKIFIQKVNGCDHMKCSKCNTDFCYRCGERYISIKLLGNHWSKFSLFGCKYRLMPQRPALRRLIRGANFAARLVAGVALAGLGIAAGAILVGASVVIVPGYGIFRLRRHLQIKKKRKRDAKWKEFERTFSTAGILAHIQSSARPLGETEAENPDDQRVQVMVHRSVSFTHEDTESVHIPINEGYEFYVNKYTTDGTDMVVSGKTSTDSDQVLVLAEVTEVQNFGGYPTVVAHIVSKMAGDKEVSTKSKIAVRSRKESSSNPPNAQINPLENSLGKDDQRYGGDDMLLNGASSAEGCLRKNVMSSADVPSCSWENLSGSQRADSGYGEGESYQEVNNSEVKFSSVISGDDADSTKRGNNGCFGNIFSRRVQAPLANLESPIIYKSNQTSGLHKKSLYHKAATWEKCHRDHMQSFLKSSPLDPVNDFNNLTLIMQKSPVSSVDVPGIFNGEVRSLKADFCNTKHGENLSESVGPKEILNTVSLHGSAGGFVKTEEESPSGQNNDLSIDDGFLNSSNTATKSWLHADDGNVSLYSQVTHL